MSNPLAGRRGIGPPIAPQGWAWRAGNRPGDMYFTPPSGGDPFRSQCQLKLYLDTIPNPPSLSEFKFNIKEYVGDFPGELLISKEDIELPLSLRSTRGRRKVDDSENYYYLEISEKVSENDAQEFLNNTCYLRMPDWRTGYGRRHLTWDEDMLSRMEDCRCKADIRKSILEASIKQINTELENKSNENLAQKLLKLTEDLKSWKDISAALNNVHGLIFGYSELKGLDFNGQNDFLEYIQTIAKSIKQVVQKIIMNCASEPTQTGFTVMPILLEFEKLIDDMLKCCENQIEDMY